MAHPPTVGTPVCSLLLVLTAAAPSAAIKSHRKIKPAAKTNNAKPRAPNLAKQILVGPADFLDFGFWILDLGFWILDLGFWILDLGFWILDFGFWILDLGFWILEFPSIRSFCGSPKRGRLDFGFRILDLGFWILDLGFWISDFGFWEKVWILHKIIATTRRLGSADT